MCCFGLYLKLHLCIISRAFYENLGNVGIMTHKHRIFTVSTFFLKYKIQLMLFILLELLLLPFDYK